MKKLLLSIPLLGISLLNAQVGINTEAPNATLDVIGNGASATVKDGFIAPRLTKQQLAGKMAGTYAAAQTGSLVYVTDTTPPTGTIPSLTQVTEITAVGYYYFDGTIWKKIGSSPDTSIYLNDGTLAGNRIVTQAGATLAFTGTAVNAFSVDGTTLSVDAANNRIGIGTAAPARPLHVDAASNPLRFQNLAALPTGTAASTVVIDTNGDIYRNTTASIEGQIIRIGLNALIYTAGAEVGLRFNDNDSAAEMGNAPNGAPNFINSIVGASIVDGVSAPAGNGSPARTTDQITLPTGVYKIQLRLVGNFPTAANANNSVVIKCIVGNNEYSLINVAIPNTSTSTTHYFEDYVNISAATQTLDFNLAPSTNNYATADKAQPAGGGNSYRSLLTIQRIK